MIPLTYNFNNLFYLIKIVRITKAIENMNIGTIVQTFKFYKDKFVILEAEKRRKDKEIEEKIVWPKVSLMARKYTTFLGDKDHNKLKNTIKECL